MVILLLIKFHNQFASVFIEDLINFHNHFALVVMELNYSYKLGQFWEEYTQSGAYDYDQFREMHSQEASWIHPYYSLLGEVVG